MKCDKCDINEASVYFEQNINGQSHAMHLCSECAAQYSMSVSLNDVFQGFMDSLKTFSTDNTDARIKNTNACPQCGLTYDELRKGGKLGCAHCYDTFSKELGDIFSNIQPGASHMGKMPKECNAIISQNKELASLRQSLKAAVSNEEYEEAARLRDKIRALSAEGGRVNG